LAKRIIKSSTTGYAKLLDDIKSRIRAAQIKAALSVNHELIALYWSIGREIAERQKTERFGKSVVERLARDLQKEFPGVHGYSARNIWLMRSFFFAWDTDFLILQQPVAELPGSSKLPQSVADLPTTSKLEQLAGVVTRGRKLAPPVREIPAKQILQQPVADSPPQPLASIPWGHNIVLLEKLKDPAARLWYANQIIANGWSRAMLVHWIESDLHQRQGAAVTNFKSALPEPQAHLFDPLRCGTSTLAARSFARNPAGNRRSGTARSLRRATR